MLGSLYRILNNELSYLNEMIRMAEKQQEALVKFKLIDLFDIAKAQELLTKKMRDSEEDRIRFLMKWLNLSRKGATELKLSALERKVPENELQEFITLRTKLKVAMKKLGSINTMNRILANRARFSVEQMISLFTNGNKHVCNVKV